MRIQETHPRSTPVSDGDRHSTRDGSGPAPSAAGTASETSTGLTWITAHARINDAMFIGDYRLIASLGRGGMAEVFLAVRSGLAGFHKLVVIKRLRRDLVKQRHRGKYRMLLLDEARLAARLSHPNIVQTFEVGEADGVPFLAMEYLDGQPLSRVLARVWQAEQELAIEFALQIVIDTLSGLAYAHALTDFDGKPLQVIHRDISPDNLFWTYDGAIKLLDFGVAKVTLNLSETDTGVVKGKFPYMAPEQARGKPIDRRADLFAVGIVMWELIAGRHLLYAPTTAASVERLLYGELPPLSQIVPDIDPEIARICGRALERDVHLRYSSAGEMRTDLEYVMASRSLRRADLAAFLQDLFRDERASVAQHIRHALASRGEPIPLVLPEKSSRVTTPDISTPRTPVTPTAPTVEAARAPGAEVVRAPAAVRWRAGAALWFTLVIALAVLLGRECGEDAPAAGAAHAARPPVAAAPATVGSRSDPQVCRDGAAQVGPGATAGVLGDHAIDHAIGHVEHVNVAPAGPRADEPGAPTVQSAAHP